MPPKTVVGTGLFYPFIMSLNCIPGTATSAHDATPPVLSQRRLSELVKEVEATQVLDEDVEEVSTCPLCTTISFTAPPPSIAANADGR